ncbi:ras-induced vulval development antagonist-domain-containing protein [Umbelopsis sp. PMI_123]|nr:ras-induced vulval development antagonist-domain-containing protein [Umbelopsis sp. PMI_123]
MSYRSRSRSPRRSYRDYSPEHQSYRRRGRTDSRSLSRTPTRSRSRSPYEDRRRRRDFNRGGSSEDIFEYRRKLREEATVNFWVPSPELRPRSPSPTSDTGKKSKRSRRSTRYSDESDDDLDSDDDRNRRRKLKKSSHRKRKSSKHKKSSSSSRRRHRRSPTPSDESVSEDDRRSEVSVSNGKDKVLEVDETQLDAVPDLWVEKQVEMADESAPVGPLPVASHDDHLKERAYGGALLPGEGSAMAAYVQEGKRIPRRGEIGLNSDQIEAFESAGFVMSGSRHQRMNAVRMRKENQVISAEEKRLLLTHASEQKLKRENEIISGFRDILSERQKK